MDKNQIKKRFDFSKRLNYRMELIEGLEPTTC